MMENTKVAVEYLLGFVSYEYRLGWCDRAFYVGRYRVRLNLNDLPLVMG